MRTIMVSSRLFKDVLEFVSRAANFGLVGNEVSWRVAALADGMEMAKQNARRMTDRKVIMEV